MVFKKMLSVLGVGGPSVDTVLTNPNTRPGLVLDGQVKIRGGDAAADIEQVTLSLVTRVEMESGDSEYAGTSSSTGCRSAARYGWPPGRNCPFRSSCRCPGRPRSPTCTASGCAA